MKKFTTIFAAILLIFSSSVCLASEAVPDNDPNSGSSHQMMEQIENIIYGYVSQGGLLERLSKAEGDLFGRSLPGTMAERHAAILNFLETGTPEQPSMLFKLGVAEWVVDKKIRASEPAIKRVERIETNLNGTANNGSPIVMRVENLLSTLLMDPVSAQPVTVPANTVMKFRFMDELSPAKSRVGDYVRLELTSDLIVNNFLVAPAGSLLITEVRDVKRPRMFGIPGEVRISFNELKPLGPQHPTVKVGKESENAIKEARRVGDRGEGGIVGAGAASVAGAALLGPVGLVGGLFIRGNSIRIPEGSVTFAQISEDIAVSSFPIPASLQSTITNNINTIPPNHDTSATPPNYDPNRDTIIKGDVFNRSQYGTPTYSGSGAGTGGDFQLPPEQPVN